MYDHYDIRRGYVFNFPRINLGIDIPGQFEKIHEEYDEAYAALHDYLTAEYSSDPETMAFVVEVMDIIHACETMLHLMWPVCDIDEARRQAILKNWERKYYVEDAAE